jgi:hypothetical protein
MKQENFVKNTPPMISVNRLLLFQSDVTERSRVHDKSYDSQFVAKFK